MILPCEIYLRIFSLLDKETLYNCIAVCKDWSLPAAKIYYKEVILRRRNIPILKEQLNQEQCFQHCRWTEVVYIDYYSPSTVTFTQREFLKFFGYLPNLKKIKTSNDKYTKYLLDVDTSQNFTKIEDIEFFSDSQSSNCALYYNFRLSLTRIYLPQDSESDLFSRYNGLSSYLSEFKNLTHLTYYNDGENDPAVYEIQVGCPGLTCLDISSYHTVPSIQAGNCEFHHYSNLKELSISFANMPTEYVQYIIRYLLKSVETLEISLDSINLYDWIYEVGFDNVLELAKGMSKLRKASLNYTPNGDSEREYENTVESDMTTFFRILHAFKGDRKVRCSIIFTDTQSARHHLDLSNNNLYMSYGLNYAEFYRGNEEDRVFEFAVPDTTISLIGFEIIHNLVFSVDKVDSKIPFKLLEHSFVHCPYLQDLRFMAGYNSPRQEFTLSSRLNMHVGPKKIYDFTTTSRENLKAVELKNMIPSQEFLDLLNYHLPDIQFIVCGSSCDSYDEKRVIRDYRVDLTPFKCLKVFNFNINIVLYDSKVDSCFIKMEYTDGEENYYQFESKGDMKFEPVSLEDIQNSQAHPTSTITFKCEKIEKISFYCSKSRDIFEILEGVPQKKRHIVVEDREIDWLELNDI